MRPPAVREIEAPRRELLGEAACVSCPPSKLRRADAAYDGFSLPPHPEFGLTITSAAVDCQSPMRSSYVRLICGRSRLRPNRRSGGRPGASSNSRQLRAPDNALPVVIRTVQPRPGTPGDAARAIFDSNSTAPEGFADDWIIFGSIASKGFIIDTGPPATPCGKAFDDDIEFRHQPAHDFLAQRN
jgi:hypothetical protein